MIAVEQRPAPDRRGWYAARRRVGAIVGRTPLAPTPPVTRTPIGMRHGDDNDLGRR